MTAAYRGAPVPCPACPVMMEIRNVDGADIDICGQCGGIWIDPTDGPVAAVTRELVAHEKEPTRPDADVPEEIRPKCPRCNVGLELDFGLPKHIDAVPERCASCRGVFLTREHALRIAAFTGGPAYEPEHFKLPVSGLARAFEVIKGMFKESKEARD